jgi:hypothetical protein
LNQLLQLWLFVGFCFFFFNGLLSAHWLNLCLGWKICFGNRRRGSSISTKLLFDQLSLHQLLLLRFSIVWNQHHNSSIRIAKRVCGFEIAKNKQTEKRKEKTGPFVMAHPSIDINGHDIRVSLEILFLLNFSGLIYCLFAPHL